MSWRRSLWTRGDTPDRDERGVCGKRNGAGVSPTRDGVGGARRVLPHVLWFVLLGERGVGHCLSQPRRLRLGIVLGSAIFESGVDGSDAGTTRRLLGVNADGPESGQDTREKQSEFERRKREVGKGAKLTKIPSLRRPHG